MNGRDVMPNALRLAAQGCNDPKWIGEILLALCGGRMQRLDRGQEVVLAMCRAEIGEREAAREAAAERKRRQRSREAAPGQPELPGMEGAGARRLGEPRRGRRGAKCESAERQRK